jgi:hypothetical protein
MIALADPRNPTLKPIEVEALADTGAVYLCILLDGTNLDVAETNL